MSWEAYINGHIVSSSSLRFIQYVLAATAATETEDSEDSSDDSDAEEWENADFKAGNMDLVQQTLQGMASRNADEGVKAMGRHARTIRFGKKIWEALRWNQTWRASCRSDSSTTESFLL